MKSHKRIAGMLLSLVLALLVCPARASALGSSGSGHACSLTIDYQKNETPVTGAAFSLYLTATADENGTLTPTPEFAGYPVKLWGGTDAEWKTLASTLEGYVRRDKLTPAASGVTDARGRLTLGGLTPGLYLVLGEQHRQDGMIYDPQPAMVLLPAQDPDTHEWNDAVTMSPKCDPRPEGNDPVTRAVLKVWKDEGNAQQRPQSVTVQLLRDGEVYDTVTLSAANNWRYAWGKLDSAYRWTVTEQAPGGYTVEITRDGDTFAVVNTWDGPDNPTPTQPDKLPQTGQLWWPVPLLIFAGLLFIVIGLLRRRGNTNEK